MKQLDSIFLCQQKEWLCRILGYCKTCFLSPTKFSWKLKTVNTNSGSYQVLILSNYKPNSLILSLPNSATSRKSPRKYTERENWMRSLQQSPHDDEIHEIPKLKAKYIKSYLYSRWPCWINQFACMKFPSNHIRISFLQIVHCIKICFPERRLVTVSWGTHLITVPFRARYDFMYKS